MNIELKKSRPYGPNVILKGTTVEKSFKDKPFYIRLFGCPLIAWEAFIYSKLKGVEGIPELLGTPDRYTILTKYLGGENLRQTSIIPDEKYFQETEVIIKKMHERCVIHLDLRNRRNYGIDEKGKPYLVDFAASLYIPVPLIIKHLCKIDWMGFAKVKTKLNPAALSEKDIRASKAGNILSYIWLPGKLAKILKKATRPFRQS